MPPSSITSVSMSPGLTPVAGGRVIRIWDDRTDQRPTALLPARHRQLPLPMTAKPGGRLNEEAVSPKRKKATPFGVA